MGELIAHGAKNTFTLELLPDDTEIYFNRPDKGYELVLVKDEETGQWLKPNKMGNLQISEEADKGGLIPMVMVKGELYLYTGHDSMVHKKVQ